MGVHQRTQPVQKEKAVSTVRLAEPKDIDLELALFVLVDRTRYRISGGEVESTLYGLAALLKVENRGTRVLYVRALELAGDVGVDYQDFDSAFAQEGQLLFALADDFWAKKPFSRLSWISWPNNEGKIDAGAERFISFVICQPMGFGMSVYSGPPQDYFGFSDGSKSPSLLTTSPTLKNLVYFTAVSNDRKRLLAPRLRPEVASGKVQFRVRWVGGRTIIPPRAIGQIRLVSKVEWEKSLPQEIFWATDFWNRANAVKKDPLMGMPK